MTSGAKEPKLSKLFTSELPEMTEEERARFNMFKAVRTTPPDVRFPHSNQALHCWNRYNEWLMCTKQSDEDKCKPLRQLTHNICPMFWVEQWDEQRDDETFSGIGSRFDHKH